MIATPKLLVRIASSLLGVSLIVLAIVSNVDRLSATGTDSTRAILGVLFSILVLTRKHESIRERAIPSLYLLILIAGGLSLFTIGVVVDVIQFRWVGILLLSYCCFQKGLSSRLIRNLPLAYLVLYWVFPLPTQIFGPLVLLMQKASVTGAEWLCQIVGIAVWLDGIILRTGLKDFEVPESCSGMQTLTAALVCGLGAGIYVGLRGWRLMVLMVAGVVQVLLLNSLRITFLVAASEGRHTPLTFTNLHDSAGLFLLLALVLIQAEAVIWRGLSRKKRQIKRDDDSIRSDLYDYYTRMTKGVAAPPLKLMGAVMAVLVLIGGVIFVIPKRGEASQSELLAGVAYGLIARQPDAAETLWRQLVVLDHDNSSYRIALFKTLLTRGKNEEVLGLLDTVSPDADRKDLVLCRCWALVGLGRIQEANQLLKGLPEEEKKYPGLAIVAAESAARGNEGVDVVASIGYAAEWTTLAPRIRRLFPYLVSLGEWKTIARVCQPSCLYDDPDTLLLALTACLQVNDQASAAQLLRNNSVMCGTNSRFLPHYLFLAERQTGWRLEYTTVLLHVVDALSADEAYEHLIATCRFHEGAAAKRLWARVMRLDQAHPGLSYLGVILPDEWSALQSCTNEAPVKWRVLAKNERTELKIANLVAAKNLLESKKTSELSYGMAMLYVDVLAQSDESRAALEYLRKQLGRFPDRKLELNLREAWLLGGIEQWQDAYELLRPLYDEYHTSSPGLSVMMVNVLMKLEMGMYAMMIAEDAANRFPDNEEVKNILAAVWESFDHADEALSVLGQDPPTKATPIVARLLSSLGRNREDQWVWKSIGDEGKHLANDRMWIVPTAESVLRPAQTSPVTGDELEGIKTKLSQSLRKDSSPFLLKLHDSMVRAYGHVDAESVFQLDEWALVGRDDLERAYSFHQLAIILSRLGRMSDSLAAIDHALKYASTSRILWRMRVALSNGDLETIRKAKAACPDDSQIWLAEVVSYISLEKPLENEVLARVNASGRMARLSTGTLIRVGDFLLRSGFIQSANEILDVIKSRNSDLLPALVLEVKVALRMGDGKRGLAAATRLADLSGDVRYDKLVAILMMNLNLPPATVITRVASLARKFPNEPAWRLREAGLMLQMGDSEAAFAMFDPIVQMHQSTLDAGVLLLAAESARRCDHFNRAIDILQQTRARFPENIHVLNNLIYTLAEAVSGLEQAVSLLDELLKMEPSSSVYDTASLVYGKSGNIPLSIHYLELALKAVETEPLDTWLELNLSAAERLIQGGDIVRARELMNGIVAKSPIKKDDGRVQAIFAHLNNLER